MPLEININEILDGGSFPARTDRILTGFSFGLAIPGPTGPLTGAAVLNAGAYTSLPTATAGGVGTGAVVTVAMGLLATPAIQAAGTSYAPNDTITTAGGTASQQAILHVQTTTLVAVPAVASGGANYAVNDQITLQNGAVVKVATLSGSAVATITLISGGSFTANNTSAGGLTQQSTTGSGTGATFTGALADYGVGSIAVLNSGVYTVLPSGAGSLTQGSTSGSGAGATFTPSTWQLASLTIVAGKGGRAYTNGTPITTSGGGATVAGTGVGTTNLIGQPVNFSVTGFQNLPASYIVNFDTDAPCNASFNGKTGGGFNVTLTPIATTQPVLATTMDIQVQG
jgi:hypothetical protein